MEHKQYIRQVPDSRVAVLMIHGIAGTPAHFRELLPAIPARWSVYNILLDGHGGSVADFAAASMEKWKAQVNDTLRALFAQYPQVVLIAHSMGTLFAIRAAVDHPDKIPFLFLLSVPTRPWVRLSTVKASIHAAWGRTDDPIARQLQDDTSIALEPNLLKYIPWAPRFIELLAEIRRVRRLLPRLQVPACSFHSYTDELVSARSVKDLENHPYIQNTILYHSGHFAYSEPDALLLQQSFAKMVAQHVQSPVR